MTGTMHGAYVNADYRLQAQFCAKPNAYVFVVYDTKHYKMTAVSLDKAKASSTPPTVDKFITAAKGSIDIDAVGTVCNMWQGDGYKPSIGNGYNLKDVKVTECGWYMHRATDLD